MSDRYMGPLFLWVNGAPHTQIRSLEWCDVPTDGKPDPGWLVAIQLDDLPWSDVGSLGIGAAIGPVQPIPQQTLDLARAARHSGTTIGLRWMLRFLSPMEMEPA